MTLSQEELNRYSRQLIALGPEAQEKLKAARVAVVGLGGLGSVVLSYLAGAGVGELALADTGGVEISNLHRQFIYHTSDAGRNKTELAAAHAKALNPNVRVTAREGFLGPADMAAFLKGCDFAVDCSDNFSTRAAVNRACLELKITYVFGSVFQFEGQLAVFEPHTGPCYECACPGAGERDDLPRAGQGIVGPTAGVVASLQASEVIKLITGLETMKGRMLLLDLQTPSYTVVTLKKRRDCPVCGAVGGL